MPCYHPLDAHYDQRGELVLGIGPADQLRLDCGKCIGCRLESSRDWTVRMLHEFQMSVDPISGLPTGCFGTLTYDDQHLPDKESVNVRDWQKFAKRLRRVQGPFRFYSCGEYGERTFRPHMHFIIFGKDFREAAEQLPASGSGEQQYKSPAISAAWDLGSHALGNVTWKSCSYVAQYVMKKLNGPWAKLEYQHTDLNTGEISPIDPPYSTQSRRPGLGHSWITRYLDQTYPADYVIINGQKQAPPKYYDKILKQLKPDLYDQVKATRVLRAQTHLKDNTRRRLSDRETCAKAKQHNPTRELIQSETS